MLKQYEPRGYCGRISHPFRARDTLPLALLEWRLQPTGTTINDAHHWALAVSVHGHDWFGARS